MRIDLERGYYLATGNGPLRPYVAEGVTRLEALKAGELIVMSQHAEEYAKSAAADYYSSVADGTYGFEGDMG